MKNILLLFVLIYSLNIQAQNEKLTNQSISDMIELGFSEDIIVTKINTSENNFNTSIDDLKVLKEKGVSNNIIVAMMQANKKTQEKEDTDNTKIGIYIQDKGEFKKILPTSFSGSKTNTLASAFTYGLASTDIKTTMNNAKSVNIVNSILPEFYFYFAKSQINNFAINPLNWWFASATSPNEFVMVKLNVKRNKRELKTGKVNIYAGSSFGIDEESTIKFKIESINDYTYKVTPVARLEPGEYCFFYQGAIPHAGFSNQSVFDFSIDDGTKKPKYKSFDLLWVIKDGKPHNFEVMKVNIRKDEVYYIEGTYTRTIVAEYKESECYKSKKELLNSLQNTNIPQ